MKNLTTYFQTDYRTNDKGRFLFTNSYFFKHALLIFIIFLTPAFIISCIDSSDEKDEAECFVKTPLLLTKSISGAGEDLVTDIFIYNDDKAGRIDTYQRCYLGSDGVVTVASRPGDKVLAAIVNPVKDEYVWEEVSSYEALTNLYADMRMDDAERPIMTGVMRFHAETDNKDDLELTLSKIMSEIRIRSIKCDFSGTPYSDAVMEDATVYLSNVNTVAPMFIWEGFMPEAPINTDATMEGAMSAPVSQDMLIADIEGIIGRNGIRPDVGLYCYPNECEEDNPGSPFTRLVITGTIMGQRYYYPININRGEFRETGATAGVGRNNCYMFDITLRRTGALSPYEPVGPETVEISWNIEPWNRTDETELIF